MFARFATILPIAALAAVVAAAPNALEARNTPPQCSTGPIQCCQSTQQSNPSVIALLSGLLGLALPDVTGLIGLSCTPVTVVGTGSGATCTAQAVCCTNNQFNGLVNLGCSPINLSL